MKKNKLAIAAGIILIIIASLSIIMTLTSLSAFIEFMKLTSETVVEESVVDDAELFTQDFWTGIITLVYLFQATIYCLQSVAFMILGIKIIGKANKFTPQPVIKPNIVLALIFACVSLVLNLFSLLTLPLIVVIVLLGCSINNNPQVNTSTITSQHESFNHDTIKDSSKEEMPNSSEIDMNDIMIKAKTAKEMRDQGVIGQKEFEKYVAKLLDNDQVKKDQEVESQEDKKDNE